MKELYLRLKVARRACGMSQTELAKAVDCKQSAISMMERGRPDALSHEKLRAIAKVLGLDLLDSMVVDAIDRGEFLLKICPIPDCPSNLPYVVSGQLMFLPQPVRALATSVTRCVYCGEILESTCSTCGNAIRPGACCDSCGNAYISGIESVTQDDHAAWASRQMENVLKIRGMLGRETAGVPNAKFTAP